MIYKLGKKTTSKNKRLVFWTLLFLASLILVASVIIVSNSRHLKPGSFIIHVAKPSPKSQSRATTSPPPKVLFFDPLNGPNRIVTNEYSYYSPSSGCPYSSATWAMTSGTLLVKNGAGYSGIPTVEDQAICDSSAKTNSAVFRLNTKAANFSNVDVSMDYMAASHGSAPTSSYDGIHIWVGYKNEYALYAASIFRWDGNLVIKKKVPEAQAQCSDPSNDGCYYDLTAETKFPNLITANVWRHADILLESGAGGSVTLVEKINGQTILTGTDDNLHGPAYIVGAVGVRGDNTEFFFKNFTVTQL